MIMCTIIPVTIDIGRCSSGKSGKIFLNIKTPSGIYKITPETVPGE